MAAKFKILPGLPGTGPVPEQFSATGQGTHSEGLVVQFFPEESRPWVGNFQGGFGECQGVFDHPNGSHLIVVATGQAYVIDPNLRAVLDLFAGDVTSMIEVPELEALVFTNGLWFEADGPAGLPRSRRWRSDTRSHPYNHCHAFLPG